MKYYVYYDRNGKIIAFNATNKPVGSSAVEVDRDAYLSVGGTIPYQPPSAIVLAQQEITDLQLSDIEQGQAVTDLELMILEGQAYV